MLSLSRFRFLNREGAVGQPEDWNDPDKPALWRYQLHYFDDLNAEGAEDRRGWHQDLIRRWIDENPPGKGVGWEPYPTSLRIVNWIKWTLRDGGGMIPDSAVHSLAIQARWLECRIEYHVLGNHLLANAKALIFAGLYFDGEEANRWYRKGRDLLESEIEEQCLEDGGHFERSAMYHTFVLEDLLDCINLYQCYRRDLPNWVRPTAMAMRTWLEVMRHPDGEIPFFNDAAFGMAPTPVQLDEYADRLGAPGSADRTLERPVHGLAATGYTRVEVGPVVAFLDIAPIGPDYLPAHAHADTLSFELSLGGQRLFVNSGTSTYERGPRREWERGTAAHNTVEVDGEDSSEVWASFRVARRARVTRRKVDELDDGKVRIEGAHNGFRRLPGRPVHSREWRFDPTGLEIVDRVEGAGRHRVDLHLHLHPHWNSVAKGENEAEIVSSDGAVCCEVSFEGSGQLHVERSRYAPEFGLLEPIDTLCYRVERSELPIAVRTKINWRDGSGGEQSRCVS